MITDAELVFCNAQELDVATATPEISENVLDTSPLWPGNDGLDLGGGQPLHGRGLVTTAFDSAADGASLEIQLVSSAAAALTSPVLHWTSGPIAEADLALGAQFQFEISPGGGIVPGTDWLRYVGFRFVASGEDITAGALTLVITPAAGRLKQYASGLNFI